MSTVTTVYSKHLYCYTLLKKFRSNKVLIALLPLLALLISGTSFSQSADIDQGQNGSATSRTSPVTWINGNLGPSGAHFAEGYSIPYRMKIASLVGNSSTPHVLIIEWDTKDQNGHALDYITHYDNMDNPSGSHVSNFSHAVEVVTPTAGTAFSGAPNLFNIPAPSATGAEVLDQPAKSFGTLPGLSGKTNATKMAIWGGTITALNYLKQDNQDATTASTKTQLQITFTSTNGSTALIAWGGHIAAEYDWGTGRGASKVSGSPYHMRLISIDGKGGNQDRSLKATAVLVPTVGCTISAAQTACEGSTTGLAYTTTEVSGVTNYSWTLSPGTTNAVIQNGTTTTTKSGATVTSVTIVPSSGGFTPGTFTLSLTLTNLGGTGSPCTKTGTIYPNATASAGGPYAMCSSDASIQLVGTYGGGATGGEWNGGSGQYGTPSVNTTNKTVTVSYTPTAGEKSTGSVALTFSTTGQTAPCGAATASTKLAINQAATANAGGPYVMCSSDASIKVVGTYGGGATGGNWSGGSGGFTSISTNTTTKTVTATYTPTAAEKTGGSVQITFTTTGQTAPCSADSKDVTLTIKPTPAAPKVEATNNCDGTTTLTVTGIEAGATISWSDDASNHDNPRTVTTAGTYKVTQTLNGCTSAEGSAEAKPKTTPAKPSVTYNAPACDEATFSVTVNTPTANATYSIVDKNGNVIPGVAPGNTFTPTTTESFNFSNIAAGSGFKVVVTNNGCPSDPYTCPTVNPLLKQQAAPSLKTTVVSETKVTAAPNPFNDNIRFTITPGASGRGSLELYNLMGQKVKTVFEGQVQKGQLQTIQYAVPNAQRTNLIYFFRVGTDRVSGKLINLK